VWTLAGEHHRIVTQFRSAANECAEVERCLTPQTTIADREQAELHRNTSSILVKDSAGQA
jgi:hypothetical protein